MAHEATVDSSRFVTTAEAARMMVVHRTAAARMVREGVLPAIQIKGCRTRIPRAAVEALLATSISGPAEMFGLSRATG